MIDLKFSEILQLNRSIAAGLSSEKYKIAILSNISLFQIKTILEYFLRREGIHAEVEFGDFDNIIQDSRKFAAHDLVIVFWELANMVDGLQYKANLMDSRTLDLFLSQRKAEIDLVINTLGNSSLVLFNSFSTMVFNYDKLSEDNFDYLAVKLNQHLLNSMSTHANISRIDIEKIIAGISVDKSINLRHFYSSKTLYSLEFYKAYSLCIKPIVLAASGKAKKVLVFDCDNTLWRGIIGEDGFDGIDMSEDSANGAIFSEIQAIALSFNRHGVLLALCSKNNARDVEQVLHNHPDMKITNNHLSAKEINWNNKADNLRAIASSLNIGVDSLVFIDDSSFEVDSIKTMLPEVAVFQVPQKIVLYPQLLRNIGNLFFNISPSEEDLKRTRMYAEQVKRKKAKDFFVNIEDYLSSLELGLNIYIDNEEHLNRIAQLTQKTNQFNLTTKRYTAAECQRFISASNFRVIYFNTRDKFGDYGVTGLAIIRLDGKVEAHIDTFLLSCRIIGRNIELAFIDFLIPYLQDNKCMVVRAEYNKTAKNEQVGDLYDRLGFRLVADKGVSKSYSLDIGTFRKSQIDYIQVNYEGKN